jgi:carboxyl-terminal processing protease
LFEEFFFTLDPESELFSRQDIAALAAFRFKLDEDLKSLRCLFLPAVKPWYISKLQRYKTFTDSVLRNPVQFREGEYGAALGAQRLSFALTTADLRKSWHQRSKANLLGKLYLQSKSIGGDEPTARQQIRESIIRKLDRALAADVERHLENCFLKSIARIYDPHSEFFTEGEMKAFGESLNSEALSFGMDFEDSRLGQVRVARLAPGGSAWTSGQIHQGDIVELVEIGKEAFVVQDFTAYSLMEVVSDPAKVSAIFTVRKADGEVRKVPLTKSKIENSSNLISSFLLRGKRTFGYISLPSFYTEWEKESTSGCANDIAKEILKLNAEKIEGLILDLRFNGGGSVQEAIDLAGIFIDAGPLAIIEERDQPPFTLKDMNRGVAFNGPLVIMISRASASASELVAAALQDLQRAIIVGGASFGKATGQVVLPVNPKAENPTYVKVTQERLYRITGASLQQTGVQVDYHLPSLMDVLVGGENKSRHSLLPRATTKKTYYKPFAPWFPTGSKALLDASRDRISRSPGFRAMSVLTASYTKEVPLGKDSYGKFLDEIEAANMVLEEGQEDDVFEVTNVTANERLFTVDAYHQQINKDQIADIQKSIYIKEVYHILEDILNSGK